MASDEKQIKKIVRDFSSAISYYDEYLLRCIASLRLNKAECEVTGDEIKAQYKIISLQMSSFSLKQVKNIKVLRDELCRRTLDSARDLSKLQDRYEDRKCYDRKKIRDFASELAVEKSFGEKDKADLRAMVEETKAAAAKEVQRLMEENAKSNSQIEALGAQNAELEKDLATLDGQASSHRRQIARLCSALAGKTQQIDELTKDAIKDAGIKESQSREIARLEARITGLCGAVAAADEEADVEPGSLTLPFVLEEDGMLRYATKEEMAGEIDQKLVEAQKKPIREYFEELQYDASDEAEDSDAGESAVVMGEESVEGDDWSVVSAEIE